MSSSQSSLAKSSAVNAPIEASQAQPASASLTTDLTQVEAMPSPALDLQENLRHAWTAAVVHDAEPANERRIPIGWALTAVALGCGAFWACVAMVIF